MAGRGARAQDNAPPAITDAPTKLTPFPAPENVRKGDMLYRALGSAGEQVSIIGLGGFPIGSAEKAEDSIRLIRSFIE